MKLKRVLAMLFLTSICFSCDNNTLSNITSSDDSSSSSTSTIVVEDASFSFSMTHNDGTIDDIETFNINTTYVVNITLTISEGDIADNEDSPIFTTDRDEIYFRKMVSPNYQSLNQKFYMETYSEVGELDFKYEFLNYSYEGKVNVEDMTITPLDSLYSGATNFSSPQANYRPQVIRNQQELDDFATLHNEISNFTNSGVDFNESIMILYKKTLIDYQNDFKVVNCFIYDETVYVGCSMRFYDETLPPAYQIKGTYLNVLTIPSIYSSYDIVGYEYLDL